MILPILKYVRMHASDCLSQACLPPMTLQQKAFALLDPLTGSPLHLSLS